MFQQMQFQTKKVFFGRGETRIMQEETNIKLVTEKHELEYQDNSLL